MGKKKNTGKYVAGGIFIIILVISIYTIPRQQSGLNNGGQIIIEPQLTTSTFNKDTDPLVQVPTDFTIYFGSGWDKVCFHDVLVYWIEDSSGKSLNGGRMRFDVFSHDADAKNLPYKSSGTATLDISGLDAGQYKLVYKNVLSSINDINVGPCKSTESWTENIDQTDLMYDVSTQPEDWFNKFKTGGVALNVIGSEEVFFNVETACEDVVCDDHCAGDDYYTNGECQSDGGFTFCGYDIEQDSSMCVDEPDDPDKPTIDSTYLIIIGVVTGIIVLIFIGRQRLKKVKR